MHWESLNTCACLHTHTHTHTLTAFAFPGGDLDCSLIDDWASEKPNAESVKASSSGHVTSQTPRENSHNSSLQSQLVASEHLQGNVLNHSSEFGLFVCFKSSPHPRNSSSPGPNMTQRWLTYPQELVSTWARRGGQGCSQHPWDAFAEEVTAFGVSP